MFMKHTISRFFRFFLVAALVAAMAGSLLPSKALGQVATTTTVTPSGLSTRTAMISWTIVAENHTGALTAPAMDDGDATNNAAPDTTQPQPGSNIVVQFPSTATLPADIGDMHVTVNTMTPFAYDDPDTDVDESMAVDIVSVSGGDTVTIQSPVTVAVRDKVTIVFAAEAEITHGDVGTGQVVSVTLGGGDPVPSAVTYDTDDDPRVTTTTNNAGAVTQWEITFSVPIALNADVSKITVSFGTRDAPSASVPSAIDRSDISVRTPNPNPADGASAGLLSVPPTTTSRSITFFTPVGVTAAGEATVVIAATAGVAHRLFPTDSATVTVAAGTNTAVTSDNYSVNQYLRFSPSAGARNATIAVSGGGFTRGTAGSISVGGVSSVGTYTVDSSGKLSGSFVASGRTGAGGPVSVTDLGTGVKIATSNDFTQRASATPTSEEVALGAPVSVTLNDFTPATAVTAVIAGDTDNPINPTTSSGSNMTNSSGGGTFSVAVPQGTGTGTKQVVITAGKTARFLITIVSRTLTVSPSSAVPGQSISVSGSGFTTNPNGTVRVELTLGSEVLAKSHAVNTDGTFLWTGEVPFNEETGDAGGPTASGSSVRWTATETGGTGSGRSGGSSGFTIQKRAITLSPSTANPGSTIEVFGSGWGVQTYGDVTSQVTLELPDESQFGPFPVSSTGEFQGALTVPANSQVTTIKVTATDNNGGKLGDVVATGKTGGFADDKSTSKNLRVPTGVVSVSPDSSSTGAIITVTGDGFPAQTNLSSLDFGGTNALPVPAPATDVTGSFTVTLTVPAARLGGSLKPGAVVITATVGRISGTTSFTIPEPAISLSVGSARPGDSLTVTGTGFSAFANVDSINFGAAPALPVPNPRTDIVGDFSATVIVPTLNPGAYTITVRTGPDFTATSPVRIVSATVGNALPPEEAFRSLTSKGLLVLAAAAPPGGTEFGAYVPGLAGNTLALVQPNGVLILTLNADARVSVSGGPALDVTANTPAFFALGSTVSVEVIE